jgi:tetratricopeptide (TPR) repeat protein
MAIEDAAKGVNDVPIALATHQRSADRAANVAGLAAQSPGGERREPEYAAATARARLEAVYAIHAQRDGHALVVSLEEPGRTLDYGPAGEFLLAEGYRLRATEGDERRALEHYDRSIAEHPEVAGAYAARARIHDRHGDRAAAIADLEHFLAVAPDSREAAFARQNLDRLRRSAR